MTHERPVLLVHPPFVGPAATPHATALAASCLRGAGAAVVAHDANREFLCTHLLSEGFQEKCLALARRRQEQGALRGLSDDPALQERLADLDEDPAQWQARLKRLNQAIGVMQGEGFYQPAALVAARREIDAALDLASLAYHPLRLHWKGIRYPQVEDWGAALSYANDAQNPFRCLVPGLKAAAEGVGTLVFCLQNRDQLLPALTLLAAVESERPDSAILLWGPGMALPSPPEGVTWLPESDPAALCTALNLQDPGPARPDYNGFRACLAPEALPDAARSFTLGQVPAVEDLREQKDAGALIARWPVEQGSGAKELEVVLRASSKAGIWNQVELPPDGVEKLGAWCAANPNLAHSVITAQPGQNVFSGPPPRPPAPEPKVGPLPPMPGRPLWRWLGQEQHLALYVQRHGVRNTRTCRVREDGSVFQLGQAVDYHFVHFPDLTEWHIDNILALITSTGRVKPDWLRHNLERSYLVAYALEEGVMVATETLKHPRPEYIKKVRERTGLDFTTYLERGYIVVRPEYRGLGVGDVLVSGCLARAPGYKTYLAIAAENKIAQQMTARHGSRFVTRYFSEEMGKEIEIWTPRGQDDKPEESGA